CRGEIDRDHAVPRIDIALGEGSAQREAARHVDQRRQPIAVVLLDATGEGVDGTTVGEIATKRESGESGVSEGCCSITRRFGGPIDEEERCAPLGERARDGFADLPLPPRSRQQNRIAEIVSRHGTEYVYDWLRMPTNRHYRFAERLERLG